MVNYSAYIEQVATHYWGEPSFRNGKELRWGKRGSKSVDLKKGTWFDHENNEGGGLVQLVKMNEPAGLASIADILQSKFAITKQQADSLKPTRWLAKVYDYYDDDGVMQYQVLRYEPKDFRQRRPDGKGGWIYNMQGVDPLPYNLPGIMQNPNKVVFIVEGEKCADKLISMGAVATTSHGGAAKWKPDLNQHFAGRRVVILPDADEAGDRHAQVVISNLVGIASEVRRVDLPGLSDKQDVYDWFNNGGTVDAMRELVKNAPLITEAGDVPPNVEETVSEGDTFPLMTIDDLRNMPPVEWLVDGVLTRHGFSVLYGPPGVGKSFLAIDMAMSIVYGRDWHGKPVKQGAVVYIAGEGVAGIGKRIKAWQMHYDCASEDVPLMLIPLAVQFRDKDDVEKLMRTISTIDSTIRCIVIDTVARSMVGMEENSSTEIGVFVDACDAVRRHADCAVLAIHHSAKDTTRGMRGSSALLGAIDTSLVVKKSNDSIVLSTEKQKDAEPIDDMGFELQQVAMIDETSAVIVRGEKPEKERPKLGMHARPAYQVLCNMLVDAKENYVYEAQWKAQHLKKYPDLDESRRSEGRRECVEKGYVFKKDGKVFINKDLDENLTDNF